MDISAQKIDNRQLEIFGIVNTSFLVDEKNRKSYFFEETFLLADISIEVVFEILFPNLSNVLIDFNDCELN